MVHPETGIPIDMPVGGILKASHILRLMPYRTLVVQERELPDLWLLKAE